MIDKKDLQLVSEVYPRVKEIKADTKEEIIALAHRVAAALRKERDTLVREQQENNSTSGLFSVTV